MVLAALSDGSKVVVTAMPGYRESTEGWSEVLRGLKERGLECPRLVIGDGHLGIWGALRNVYPEVRRRLDRVWHVIENSELGISDATSRIREHRERQEKLEIAAEEARALLSERHAVLDNVDTIAAFAEDMSEFLMTSEITESRAFIKSFVKEIKVKPGKATVYYTIPMPQDSPIGGMDAEEVALHAPVLSTVKSGGPARTELSLSQKSKLLTIIGASAD